ncbi:hypothetical protein [Paenibacillus sp. FSL H8-0034]|uniref:hypothetical protein n=1 Tax=Paenibacillus sp. FSL H8-0034 TaxID=2954671 RepID=UPI0030FAF33F
MQIRLLERTMEFDSNSTAEQCIEAIKLELNNNKLYCSGIIVNGETLYDDFGLYLTEHFFQVEHVEIVTQTLEQLVYETSTSTYSYLNGSIQALPQLASGFNSNPTEDTWTKLGSFFEGMVWTIQSMTLLSQHIEHANVINDINAQVNMLSAMASDLETAVNNKDYVLLADILEYEVMEIYSDIAAIIKTLILEDNANDKNR